MSDTHQADDLAPDEIKDIDEFYANDDGKKKFKTPDEFIRWLND